MFFLIHGSYYLPNRCCFVNFKQKSMDLNFRFIVLHLFLFFRCVTAVNLIILFSFFPRYPFVNDARKYDNNNNVYLYAFILLIIVKQYNWWLELLIHTQTWFIHPETFFITVYIYCLNLSLLMVIFVYNFYLKGSNTINPFYKQST